MIKTLWFIDSKNLLFYFYTYIHFIIFTPTSMFSAGDFALGVFSAGIFSIGIFSTSIFNVAIYATGIFVIAYKKKLPKLLKQEQENSDID
ncbi:hypothetical protein ACFLQ3_02950 [Bacteroidota bacterium]